MAIPKMEDDVEVIAALGDVPGSDDGLSAQQLKEKFDLAAVRLKNYINNILLPELNMIVDVKELLEGIIDKTLTKSDMAAESKAVGDAIAKKLSLSGDTMSGVLDMNSHRIANVQAPTSSGDAANKNYVDEKRKVFTASIAAGSWSGSGPYTQSVSISGILATDMPHISPVYSDTLATALAQQEAWSLVSKAVTANGSITFTCFEEKPVTAIPIQVEVNR